MTMNDWLKILLVHLFFYRFWTFKKVEVCSNFFMVFESSGFKTLFSLCFLRSSTVFFLLRRAILQLAFMFSAAVIFFVMDSQDNLFELQGQATYWQIKTWWTRIKIYRWQFFFLNFFLTSLAKYSKECLALCLFYKNSFFF